RKIQLSIHGARGDSRDLSLEADGAGQFVNDFLFDKGGVHVEDGEAERGASERAVQLEDGFDLPGACASSRSVRAHREAGAEKLSSTTRAVVGDESGRVARCVMGPRAGMVGRRAASAVWQAVVMWGPLPPMTFGVGLELAPSWRVDLAKRVAIKMADPLVSVACGGFSIFTACFVPVIFNGFRHVRNWFRDETSQYEIISDDLTMLTESFIASVLSGDKPANSAATKDVGIHLYDFQPIAALQTSFKKSSTPANCLAVSASHIFAAQAEKAVVHVYNREKGNQEAIVPFPERIHSAAFAGDPNGAGVLLLGTDGGRPSPHAPLRSLPNHRAAITALAVGHSASNTNIAVSGSKDNTCIVWDYHTGTALHTFLLPSTPLCLALDPADRAVYAGYDDGSIQLVDFYKNASITHALHDPALQSTPTQPPPSDRWALPTAATSSALCLDVSYDGTTILSGHQNGKVQTWDVAKGRYNIQLADFSVPVTNLHMLPPSGFPNTPQPSLKIHHVVKPRYESSLDGGGNTTTTGRVPANYTFTAQFKSNLPSTPASIFDFHSALAHPSFPTHMLEEGITELATWHSPKSHPQASASDPSALPVDDDDDEVGALQKANALLTTELLAAQQAQKRTMVQVLALNHERAERVQQDEIKAKKKKERRLQRMKQAERKRKLVMGLKAGSSDDEHETMAEDEEDMEGVEEEEPEDELSSSTDEMTPSD
ncbi:MAG: hypothetical protein LQ347_003925, partial [Umbilicaria vellea]